MDDISDSTTKRQQHSFIDNLKAVSLRASGVGFILGDAAFFAADRMNNDKTGSMTGLTYIAGAVVAAKYGKENPRHHLHQMNLKLRQHLLEKGITIPSGATLDSADLKKPNGLVDQVENFFYCYPSQILNGMFALGGTFKVAAGLKKEHGKYSTMAYGGLVMLAGLTGLLVPEKEPDPLHPPNTIVGKIREKIQAHPLRVSSAIYLINNGNLVVNAFEQRKEHLTHGTKAGYPLTFLTACAYIVSNGLLGLASKDSAKSTKNDPGYVAALENASAEILAMQPAELRDALVEDVAQYLSSQREIKLSSKQLAADIHLKIDAHVKRHTPNEQWQKTIVRDPGSAGNAL